MANDDLQRFLDELRARVSIVDVVGAKVKLTKKGREYQGLCPFHNEKTPSFTVNESKGFYHCFGCGAHGDILGFEINANGLPFMDAVQKLAHQAGLQMPQFNQRDKAEHEEKKSLYEIMEQACTFFEKSLRLPAGAEGLKYFTEKRGLSKEIIQKFRLGYAPNNNALMALLKSQNIDEKDMKELGLIAIPEDNSRRPHDFFRNRVMIPIMNKQGKIIAFGGRVMEKIEPKYLNSPETPIFNKRRNLYNLDKAREVAYKEKKLIICEGYMDVIALDRYGFGYAVAPLGTALTEEQITEAWKVVPEPILCLDGDAPGVKAAMRAVDRVLPILKAGYSLKFLFLPDNQDPDEYLQAHGHDSFAALMTNTSPLIDILWRKYTENEDSSTPERKALIEKTLLGEVAKITDPIVRSYYAQEIKNRIYLNFRQTAWQKEKPTATQSPSAPAIATPKVMQVPTEPIGQHPSTSSMPPFEWHSQPSRDLQRQKAPSRRYQNSAPKRPALNHLIATSPETLRQTANSEQDNNISFIIAAMLIYPELIDDFEEQIYFDEIKDNNLKNLLQTMVDIYHETETPLTGDALKEEILKQAPNPALKTLWELDMLKKQNPFINDLRRKIETALSDMKLRELEKEIKKMTDEVCKNFTEENYTRLTELKKERDEILSRAANPED
ncbi:MAG: DNA primase [Acetobacter sp.]|nr:DNA primase [Acetobacter sp.]